ncbi:MAG: hypothetical protein WCE38_10320 [Burkholderiales bacterium]
MPAGKIARSPAPSARRPVRRRRPGPNVRRQRAFGLALILVILVLGSIAFLVRGFTPASLQVERDKVTERALAQAKAALIGYAARDPNRPGSLPCPDPKLVADGTPMGDGNLTWDGVSTSAGTPFNCTGSESSTRIGRLPWRTLGLPELRDGDGELLWYVVSPRFRAPNTSALNSDVSGDIETRTPTNQVIASNLVALVIAPGRVVGAEVRPSNHPAQYLELQDPKPGPDATPAPAGPVFQYQLSVSGNSNDSILPISHADLFAVVDQAVFRRMQMAIVPKMQALAAQWTRYPFARPFDPSAIDAPGVASTTEGSLAWSPNAVLNPTWSAGVVSTSGSGTVDSASCAPPSSNQLTCTIIYHDGSIDFEIVAGASKAGLSFTDVTWPASPPFTSPAWTGVAGSTLTSGNATARFTATLPSPSPLPSAVTTVDVTLTLGLANWADRNAITPDPATEWFVKNQWYAQVYYAVSTDAAFGGSGGCAVGTSCLSVTNALTLTTTNNNQVIMALAGRALNGTPRPSATLNEYLEGGNQSQFDLMFETGPRTFTRNDKIAILAP